MNFNLLLNFSAINHGTVDACIKIQKDVVWNSFASVTYESSIMRP